VWACDALITGTHRCSDHTSARARGPRGGGEEEEQEESGSIGECHRCRHWRLQLFAVCHG
jgi:hypothetical protein